MKQNQTLWIRLIRLSVAPRVRRRLPISSSRVRPCMMPIRMNRHRSTHLRTDRHAHDQTHQPRRTIRIHRPAVMEVATYRGSDRRYDSPQPKMKLITPTHHLSVPITHSNHHHRHQSHSIPYIPCACRNHATVHYYHLLEQVSNQPHTVHRLFKFT